MNETGAHSFDGGVTRQALRNSLETERLAHIVRRVMRCFQSGLEQHLFAHNVNYGFWFYLRELWGEEGLSKRELSERVGLTEPTTHSVINRMVAAELVEMRPIVEGKPRKIVFLTEKGRALQNQLEPLAWDLNDVAVKGLSEKEVSELKRMLLLIHANLIREINAYG